MAEIEVIPATVGGTVEGSTTLCEDDEATYTLTLGGHTGEVIRWERSLTGIDQWVNITHTQTTLDYSDLEETTYFRAIVKSGVCEEVASASAQIQIDKTSLGGTLNGSATVCSGDNSTTLTLSGYRGAILDWEQSPNGTSGWTGMGQTATTLTIDDLTATTYYRVLVENGVCGSEYSTVAEIEVYPETDAGVLTAPATVCIGDNAGEINLSGYVGEVVRWESSLTGEAPWTPIVHTSATLQYEDLLENTWYRAVVKSGVCEERISNEVKIQVDALTIAGELSGPSEVCSELNGGTLTLNDYRGSILRWQQSEDEITWADIANNTATQDFENLTTTTYYRVEVQNGVCTSQFTPSFKVQVNELPVVNFSSSEVCEGLGTAFTNSSNVPAGSVASQLWLFGDASSSVSHEPVHKYDSYGTYPVKLIVTSKAGCVDSLSQAAVVHPNPVAKFTQNNVCIGFPMDFSDLSSVPLGTITTYQWDFGEGNVSSEANPSHQYDSPEVFSVTLQTTTDQGCVNSVTQQIEVYPEPVADFTFPGNVCLGTSTVFTNNSAISEGNLLYSWDFDDGSATSGEQHPTHTFSDAGIYDVTLTVTSVGGGCVDVISKQIEVYDVPVADFSFSDHCFGELTEFTNESTIAGGTMSYLWLFGDGTESTDANPVHSYDSPGTYQVTLVTTSGNNCVDERIRYINIHPNPVAMFEVSNTCLGSPAVFSNLSNITSGSLSYEWTFGDGNTSTAVNPSHTYAAAGIYNVQVVATSGFDCVDSYSTTVRIFPATVGGTVAGSTTLCEDDDATYTLTLGGHTGEVIRWERSLTGVDQWINITHTATTLDYSDLEETTYFRAIVQSGLCDEVASASAQIQIDQTSLGGTLNGSATVCSGDNSTTLTLSGYRGAILDWEQSPNGTSGWTGIGQTATTLTIDDLTATTYYRVLVENGVCGSEYSTVAEIEVYPETDAGVLTAPATVCIGDNAGEVNLSGLVGEVVRWESSLTGEAPWTPIVHTSATLQYEDLLENTWYRAVVKSGVCEERISNEVKIQVDALTIAGELSGPSEVCSELNGGTLTLNDYRGSILRWQQSEDEVAWTDITNNTAIQDFADLTVTTYYRVEVQNGVCTSQFTPSFKVQVNELPVVNFSSSEVCEGLGTAFTNSSNVPAGSVASQLWLFGDASSSVSHEPVHKYDSYGTYPVKLIVTSKAGCVDSLSQAAVVHPNPVAKFTQNNVCIGFPMDFSDLSSVPLGTITTYQWKLGDGNEPQASDFSHTYQSDGSYQVNLRIATDQGCTDETTKTVVVYPEPVTTFETSSVCFGEDVKFWNNSAISSGNLTYLWNFGDFSQSNHTNPSHRYQAAGTYIVNLQSTTVHGCFTEQSQTIHVYEQPIADFTFQDICLDTEASFIDTSFGTDLAYTWQFGDGEVSNDKSPTHAYKRPTIYDVTLQVENAEGCASTVSQVINVEPMPVVSFVMEDVCQYDSVEFVNHSTIASGAMNFLWNYGDGESANDTAPKHQYATDGTYTVTLTATSDFGCQTVLQKPVEIFPLPQPAFYADGVCDGFPSLFINESKINSGTIVSCLWDFGDQTNSIVLNPTKQYLNPGTYTASLLTESDKGCKIMTERDVVVYDAPVANFTIGNVCYSFAIEPQNTSEIASGTLLFNWRFGDGFSSASREPAHIYEEPGDYNVTLTATSEHNCQDSLTRQVRTYQVPEVDAGADTTISQGYSTLLTATGGSGYSWYPTEGLSNSNIASPVATPLQTTDYEVLVTDQFGCQNSDTVRVTVLEDFKIIATNVFTPDENGQNDSWVIENVETFGDVNVRVYDRYGSLVFQQTAYQNDWKGTYGNDILPDGTYFYLITFSASNRKYQGALTIIRNR